MFEDTKEVIGGCRYNMDSQCNGHRKKPTNNDLRNSSETTTIDNAYLTKNRR